MPKHPAARWLRSSEKSAARVVSGMARLRPRSGVVPRKVRTEPRHAIGVLGSVEQAAGTACLTGRPMRLAAVCLPSSALPGGGTTPGTSDHRRRDTPERPARPVLMRNDSRTTRSHATTRSSRVRPDSDVVRGDYTGFKGGQIRVPRDRG